MPNIKKVAVIGTGIIGAGWIIRCLAHNKIVYAFDKDLRLKKNLISEIKRTWPYVKKLFNKKKLNLKNLYFFTSIEKTLKNADFIQECITENYSLKTKLMNTIGIYAKPRSIIAFSIFLIVTGGSVIPKTQAPSQGAGQVRPVNSGKLFVLCSRSSASRQRPL